MTPPGGNDLLERLRVLFADRFEIVREITGGGMSRVFLVRDRTLDRPIVMKILPPDVAAEVNRERFRREIQLAARLHHPHIVPLFSAAEEGGLLYYTMPYIEGESLREQLEAGRRFGTDEVVEILLDVAGALAYAHRAGVVHRDVKPANILREGDHAVITDFGVAKALSSALGTEDRTPSMTTSGVAIGTPAYMAPEQLAGETSADHRVDIYALGLLGYELLTGHTPFRAPSPQAMMAAQLTRDPEPLLSVRPETPPALAAVLTRCLDKDAARRPASAEAVLEVLRTVSVISGTSASLPVQHPVRGNRWAVLVGVGGLGLVAAWGFLRGPLRRDIPTPPATAQADSGGASPATGTTPPDTTTRGAEASSLRDERLLRLLRDSIANALRRASADSQARARAAQAQQSIRDSQPRATSTTGSAVAPPRRNAPLTPEVFAARAANLGPARRIAVIVHSSLRSPALIIAAGTVRDSMMTRLRTQRRYVVVPNGEVATALEPGLPIDTLRVRLNLEMLVIVNVSGSIASDSLRWLLSLRDFTAHPTYASRSALSPRVPVGSPEDPAALSKVVDEAVKDLGDMDAAPRRDTTATRSP